MSIHVTGAYLLNLIFLVYIGFMNTIKKLLMVLINFLHDYFVYNTYRNIFARYRPTVYI